MRVCRIISTAITFFTSNGSTRNLAVPGREVGEDVDDSIDLVDEDPVQENSDPANIIDESTTNSNEEETHQVFQDKHDMPQPWRLDHVKKPPGEAVSLQEVPKSYMAATTPENIDF